MNSRLEDSTIMVVDDTPANLKLLREILEARGYTVLAFPRGAMALAAAAKNPPDLILLDITMPEMDGFEVCGRLKADTALKDIPVLFISALSEIEDKVRAFSSGGVDYITKPFHFEEVSARVETHLHLRRMQLEIEKHNLDLRRMQLEIERHNLHLQELVEEKVQEISDSQLAAIVALAKLAESRDDDTGHHVERTRSFSRLLATKLRENPGYKNLIDDTFIEYIYQSAPLHDIGKVGISDNILLKPGKLTAEEFDIMKAHPMIGSKTLRAAQKQYPRNAFLNMGIDIAHSHHEKWDGSGYPDGLAGDNIPLSARIMAVADVYDALRAIRSYKTPFSHEKSCEIIIQGAGSHFDPAVIEAFSAVEAEFDQIREKMYESES